MMFQPKPSNDNFCMFGTALTLSDLRLMAQEDRQTLILSLAASGARGRTDRPSWRPSVNRNNFNNFNFTLLCAIPRCQTATLWHSEFIINTGPNRPKPSATVISASFYNDRPKSRVSGRTRPFNRSGRSFRNKWLPSRWATNTLCSKLGSSRT